MRITIEIPDRVVRRLETILRSITKPPRKLEDGTTVIEPQYSSIEEFIADILAANFRNYVREIEPDEEERRILSEIDRLQRQLHDLSKPVVRRENAVTGQAAQDKTAL